ncbi:hypothetical protein ACM9HO_12760, partial [Pseudomonas sp. KHB2.9]
GTLRSSMLQVIMSFCGWRMEERPFSYSSSGPETPAFFVGRKPNAQGKIRQPFFGCTRGI